MAEHSDVSATSGDNVILGRPGEKRTTSSARQPMTGLPLPERVIRKRNARIAIAGVEPARTNVWRAQLAKVLSCEGVNYDGGKGLVTVFEFSEARPSSRCALKCDGNSQKLVITLSTFVQHQDPSPSGLFEIVLPSEDDLLDLRIYESTRCLELRLTPKGEASSKQEPRKIWSLFFRTDIKHLNNAKKMVKRLENVTSEMPEHWFSYRNYSRSPNPEPPTEGSEFVPRVFSQHITGGHVWNFTGFIASLEFQRALGNVTADAGEDVLDPVPAMMTRSRAKAEKRAKKQERRRQARRKTAGQSPDDDSVAEDVDSSANIEDVPGMSLAEDKNSAPKIEDVRDMSLAEDNDSAPNIEHPPGISADDDDGPSLNVEDVPGMSPDIQSREQREDVAQSARSPSIMSQEYEIEKVLDVRVREPRTTEFLVQWVGYEWPTWQPASLVPPSSIEGFYRDRFAASQPQSERRRSTRRGRGVRRGTGVREDTADDN